MLQFTVKANRLSFAIRRRFYLEPIVERNLSRPDIGLLRLSQSFRLGRTWLTDLVTISILLTVFLVPSSAQAQSTQTSVQIVVANPQVRIRVESAKARASWSFLNSYGSAEDLALRLRKIQAIGASGEVPAGSLTAGVYRPAQPVSDITYDVWLGGTPAMDAAQVSWLRPDCGLLVLNDLLPQEILKDEDSLNLSFELPRGWSVQSSIPGNSSGNYSVKHPRDVVFVVSPTIKTNSKTVAGTKLYLVSAGPWPFDESRALTRAARILKHHSRLTGFRLLNPPVIFLLPLPLNAGNEKWVAETKGSAVVLLLDARANHKNWVGQLEVIFTHELLHLWVPNSLSLTGAYDWFFEGFTVYQALQAAVELKAISFDEYLNTLARVYDSYLAKSDEMSLIEASEQRWTSNASNVYDKGMLLAFLYDLQLRQETGGKHSLAERYAELFRRYATRIVSANEAIMSLLIRSEATSSLLKSYLEERQPLNLSEALKKYGLLMQTNDGRSALRVASNPTKDQLRLLKSLGYRS